MTPLKTTILDCQTFSEVAKKQGVPFTELADLTGKVPHVGFGGASKGTYHSPSLGGQVWVLERNGFYAGDAYENTVYLFDADFTDGQAAAFLKSIDAAKPIL